MNFKINKGVMNVGIYILSVCLIFLIPVGIMKFSDKNFKLNNEIKGTNENRIVDKSKLNLNIVKVNYKGKIIELDLEEYVTLVVASEMPASFDEEALKAQSILARTFVLAKKVSNCKNADGAEICSTIHCQVFTSKSERMSSWGKNANEYYEKISKAVNDTKGMVLSYKGNLAMHPQYFAVSAGKTEDAVAVFSENIPYLKSVESKGEEIAPKYKVDSSFSVKSFLNIINSNYKNANLNNSNYKNEIKILSRTTGGSVKEIKIGNEILKGTEFRKLLDLNSANFNISYSSKNVVITSLGYGHDVGMSQWGANVRAKNGEKYNEILEHYFSGCKIEGKNKVDFNGKE